MTAPVNSFKLGKSYKIFVGATGTTALGGAGDAAFTVVVNENQFTLTYKVDSEKVDTKAGGQITIPDGTESYELKGQIDCIFADPAAATLVNARNQAWPFQIRNVDTSTVFAEGLFIPNQLEFKNEAKGVTSISFTMENSGPITFTMASERAVGTGS